MFAHLAHIPTWPIACSGSSLQVFTCVELMFELPRESQRVPSCILPFGEALCRLKLSYNLHYLHLTCWPPILAHRAHLTVDKLAQL